MNSIIEHVHHHSTLIAIMKMDKWINEKIAVKICLIEN